MRKGKTIQFKTARSSERERTNDTCNAQSKLPYIEWCLNCFNITFLVKHKESHGSNYLCSRRKRNHGLYWFFPLGRSSRPSVSLINPAFCLVLPCSLSFLHAFDF